MKGIKHEVKIGGVAVLAILIIYFGIMFLKGIALARTNNVYYVTMADVNGLAPQAEVQANGMTIGSVKSLKFDAEGQRVIIAAELQEGYQLPQGTTATLSKDMLGAPKLRLVLGGVDAPKLQQGDTIPGVPMIDLMSAAGDMLPSVEAVLPKLDSLLVALQAVAANPAIAETMQNLAYVTANLKTATDGLNTILQRDLPPLMGHVNVIGDNLAATTANLRRVDMAGIAQHADSAIVQLEVFTNRLNNPNSSLGLLLNDDNVYRGLDSTMQNASRLLEDLRLNPKRYVHFSLFGRKEK